MADLTEAFKNVTGKKVLGVPFPVAAGVVVVGTIGYGYIRNRNNKAQATAQSADPGTTNSDAASVADNISSSGGFTALPTLTATGASDTNDSWSRRAIDWLVANKGLGYGAASQIVQDYMSGNQLSIQSGQYRDAVVSALGLPPTIPSGGSTLAGSPASKQGTPPCAHIVQGTNDSTWLQLAYLYYGTAGVADVANLQSANPGHSEPLPTGDVLQIPAKASTPTPTAVAPSSVTNYGWFIADTTYTLDSIARRYQVTSADIHAWNPGLTDTVRKGTAVKVRANAGPLAPTLKYGAKL